MENHSGGIQDDGAPPRPGPSGGKVDYVAAAILAAAACVTYCRTFDVPFTFDDYVNIVWNFRLRSLNVPVIFRMKPSRFLAMLSFALNYHVNGLSVWPYHAVNLFIHIAASLGVFWLLGGLMRALERKGVRIGAHGRWIRLFGAAVFALHPLQTQAVTYIIQRIESLAGMFYILAVAAYLSARLAQTRRKRALMFLAAFLATVVAMFCKETAFTIPFTILAVELVVLSEGKGAAALLAKAKRLLPLFVLLPLVPVLLNVQGVLRRIKYDSGVTPLPYFFTQMKVHLIYLRLLFFPWGQRIDYDVTLTQTPFEPAIIIGFVVMLALAVTAFVLARKAPLVALGIFWYFLAISISSSFIPIPDMLFEHRLYPAMPGLALVLCGILLKLRWRPWMAPALAAVALVLGALTFLRNEVWRRPELLWADNVAKCPEMPRPHLNLAMVYANKAKKENPDSPDYTRAKLELEKAIELRPTYGAAYYKRGLLYESEKNLSAAIESYRLAVGAKRTRGGVKVRVDKGTFAAASERLGIILFREKKDNEGARELFEISLRLNPHNAFCHANLGRVYSNLGRSRKAIEHSREAFRLQPNLIFALQTLGIEYMKLKDAKKARQAFLKIIELYSNVEPSARDRSVYKNLAAAYALENDSENEKKYLEEALKLDPNYLDALWARFELAMINLKKQKGSPRDVRSSAEARRAAECARRILIINPKHPHAALLREIASWK